MPLILAEFCGRWGCTWQEKIINVILASLDAKSALILLGILLMPILFGVLMFLAGLVNIYELILFWGRAVLGLSHPNKSQQQGRRILPTVKFLGRTLIVANKAITDYRQDQDVKNQTNSQQQDTQKHDEPAVNSVSNEAVNNSVKPQPQRQHILTTARFLSRTLQNIAKD
jgi:hypothetical protein